MRFLVDANLPPALARWLSLRGHKGTHVGDHGLAGASDAEIWIFADEAEMVIISKDGDFAQRRMFSESGPQVVWLRWASTRREPLLRQFEALFPEIVAALERGEVLIEVSGNGGR